MEKKLKVLFVVSGNSKSFKLSPFIKSQGEAIISNGIEIDFYSISEKGFVGYLKNIKKLSAYLKNNAYDLIHAHYMLCGWVSVLAKSKCPIVLSLMGDDAYGTYKKRNKVSYESRYLTVLTFLIQPFLKGIISKSKNIDSFVYRRKIANIIPNGVNLQQFPNFKQHFRSELGLDNYKHYILFLGDPKDNNKNFVLVERAFNLIKNENIELLSPFPISQENVIKYLWSVDVFVLCSFSEGSANVIKEAMACNCPIVSTDAGDAKWIIGNTDGCYVAELDIQDYSQKILNALVFAEKNNRTHGRQRILELNLDSDSVSRKIIEVYNRLQKKSF